MKEEQIIQKIIEVLSEKDGIFLDEISNKTNIPINKILKIVSGIEEISLFYDKNNYNSIKGPYMFLNIKQNETPTELPIKNKSRLHKFKTYLAKRKIKRCLRNISKIITQNKREVLQEILSDDEILSMLANLAENLK